jgi:ketosteroid isomerase-like protein
MDDQIDRVMVVERRWVKAHLEMDLEAIESILSDDYRHIGRDGSLSGKRELLESYGSGERYWETAESSEHDVRVIGEAEIMVARWRGKGVNSGQAFDYSARFLSIFVLEGGEWKLYLDVSVPLDEISN